MICPSEHLAFEMLGFPRYPNKRKTLQFVHFIQIQLVLSPGYN